MVLPNPGTSLAHWYLWHYQANQGSEEGVKSRPCLVVRTATSETGDTTVYIAPITTQPPDSEDHSISIPSSTQQRLKLGDTPSWIITDELNSFTWVGPMWNEHQMAASCMGQYLPASSGRHRGRSCKLPEGGRFE